MSIFNHEMNWRRTMPYDVILHVIIPFLVSNKDACINSELQGSEIIFTDKQIYENYKRYLPTKSCENEEVQFFNKTLCKKCEPEKSDFAINFMLETCHIKKNNTTEFYHHKNGINLQLIEDVFSDTPIKLKHVCCSGRGFGYEMSSDFSQEDDYGVKVCDYDMPSGLL